MWLCVEAWWPMGVCGLVCEWHGEPVCGFGELRNIIRVFICILSYMSLVASGST